MIIFKITVLLWVSYWVARLIDFIFTDNQEKCAMVMGYDFRMTPVKWFMVIDFILAVIGSVATIIWFLFFVL